MGKTIITYLVDGSPLGIKILSISNRLCRAIVIPRMKLEEAKNREELGQVSLYLLLGKENQAYIGETENFVNRIKDHDYKKDFWNHVLVFQSQNNSLTKAEVQYLEYLSISQVKLSKQYFLEENKRQPKAPNLPEHQKDSTEEFFQDLKLITNVLGYDLFNPPEKNLHYFYCRNQKGTKAKGFYSKNEFVVKKGGIILPETTSSYYKKEERMYKMNQTTKKTKAGFFELQEDLFFSSPSAASDFILGRSSNGWIDWKDQKGRTLEEIYRA